MSKIDLLLLYNLYIHSLMEREEYGEQYGDTDELLKMYEEQLEANGIHLGGR